MPDVLPIEIEQALVTLCGHVCLLELFAMPMDVTASAHKKHGSCTVSNPYRAEWPVFGVFLVHHPAPTHTLQSNQSRDSGCKLLFYIH